jgi:acetylglutamate kinase
MEKLTLIKVGGQIVEEPETLNALLKDFSALNGKKVLVHGGGRAATRIASQLGIESKMINGRRVTDTDMLNVVTMVYGGLVNKKIVSGLQALGVNALGLTGADMNYMRSDKRPVKEVDYGFVGDVKEVNSDILADLIEKNVVHDGSAMAVRQLRVSSPCAWPFIGSAARRVANIREAVSQIFSRPCLQ